MAINPHDKAAGRDPTVDGPEARPASARGKVTWGPWLRSLEDEDDRSEHDADSDDGLDWDAPMSATGVIRTHVRAAPEPAPADEGPGRGDDGAELGEAPTRRGPDDVDALMREADELINGVAAWADDSTRIDEVDRTIERFLDEADGSASASPTSRFAADELATAERMRLRTREEAVEILRRAHHEASLRITDLVRESRQLRAEADGAAAATRLAADEYFAEQVRIAEAEREERMRSAELEARAIVDQANELLGAAQHEAGGIIVVAKREAARTIAEAQQSASQVLAQARKMQAALEAEIDAIGQARLGAEAVARDTAAGLREVARRAEATIEALLVDEAEPHDLTEGHPERRRRRWLDRQGSRE